MALHQRSEEVLNTIFEIGNVAPSQVTSEYSIEHRLYQVDHLIELEGEKKVVVEFDGPYHFIKDEMSMDRYENKHAEFTNLNKQLREPFEAETAQIVDFLQETEGLEPLFESMTKIDLFKTHAQRQALQPAELIPKIVNTPVRTRDAFKKYYFLPKLGYEVIQVPYFVWDPIISLGRHKPYLKHLFRVKNIKL